MGFLKHIVIIFHAILSFSKIESNLLISHDFELCEPINKTFSLRQDCNKLSTPLNALKCEIFVFQAKLFINDANYEDSFSFINTPVGREIVYINKGSVFATECEKVHSLAIPSMVNECTSDLPVFFKNKTGDYELVFLVKKNDILRRKSKKVECNKGFHYENEEFSINRFEKLIYIKNNDKNNTLILKESTQNTQTEIPINFANLSLYETSNKITLLNETTFNETLLQNQKTNKSNSSDFMNFYTANIDSNVFIKILRDFIIAIIVLILIIILKKDKINGVMNVLRKYLKKKYDIDVPIDSIIEITSQIVAETEKKQANDNLKCKTENSHILCEGLFENKIKLIHKEQPTIQEIQEIQEIKEIKIEADLKQEKRKPGRPKKHLTQV